jgi:PIN domain nuclease of toxin-antitoxin system
VREALREGAGISAVNLAEVVGKLKAKGKDPDRILRRLLARGSRRAYSSSVRSLG